MTGLDKDKPNDAPNMCKNLLATAEEHGVRNKSLVVTDVRYRTKTTLCLLNYINTKISLMLDAYNEALIKHTETYYKRIVDGKEVFLMKPLNHT